MTLDAASVLLDGPWNHRLVSANGARFHVAELGDGPMVLLMHGFPQFWYTWRHQMAAIADAGWRAVAMDLRGYGASDKPPRGYSTYTGAEDAASLIRSLGEDDAIVVGQGLGGFIAWSMPYLQPDVVRAVGSLSMTRTNVTSVPFTRVKATISGNTPSAKRDPSRGARIFCGIDHSPFNPAATYCIFNNPVVRRLVDLPPICSHDYSVKDAHCRPCRQ